MKPPRDDPEQTGRMGFLEPDEPPDGVRKTIVRNSIYRDLTEQMTYENAVEANPRGRDESPLSYIRRIAELVAEKRLPAPLKPMPEARLPYKDQDDVLQELRRQADEITAKSTA
jgi:hypothetical protein